MPLEARCPHPDIQTGSRTTRRWNLTWRGPTRRRMGMPAMDGTVTAGELARLHKDFPANPIYRLAQNAVTRVTVDDVAIDREIVSSIDHSLSTTLDDWKVTNQERSGRCWLFAGLNLLRVGVMRGTGLKDFEFSQNYTMFWDKLERANYLLEAIIETADRDLDDRTVAFLLDSAAGDGGQWNMFAALVAKHGLVPKTQMPETQSSSNTGRMNSILRYQLRQGARAVRAAAAQGTDAARALRLAVDGQGQEIPPGRRDHPTGVRGQVRGPAGQRLRLPGQRPPAVQPAGPDLHRRVPRQRRRRPAGVLPPHAGGPPPRAPPQMPRCSPSGKPPRQR